MIKYLKIFTVIITSTVFLSSCIDYKFENPEQTVYNPDIKATTTIDELKNLYEGSLTYLDTNVVISGTVIANDKTGNYYKSIVIQDSTSGIEISLNAYELHNDYHVGDLIFVKCNGLYLGEYGGVVQLGYEYEGGIGRIEEPMIKDYLIKSDGGIAIKPKTLSLAAPNASLINQLVIIKNAQFRINEIGGTYADGVNQIDYERNVEDCDGNSMAVRTSGYSDFANDLLPSGNGTFIGVMSQYNGTFQLKVRNPNEIIMNEKRCGALFSEDFDNGLGQFTAFNIAGTNNSWTQGSFGNTTYAKMTGYYVKAYEASEDWLVSTPIDLSETTNAVLNFNYVVNYLTTWTDIKVLISSNYDGASDPTSSGTWTELTGWAHSAGTDWVFVDSGDVDISSYAGNQKIYIAFKYTSPSYDASTWEIDKVSVLIP